MCMYICTSKSTHKATQINPPQCIEEELAYTSLISLITICIMLYNQHSSAMLYNSIFNTYTHKQAMHSQPKLNPKLLKETPTNHCRYKIPQSNISQFTPIIKNSQTSSRDPTTRRTHSTSMTLHHACTQISANTNNNTYNPVHHVL